ncbi:MAG: hypothetical protein N2313_07780, partial [Meiothermus ruber]|nr:hypothetical protein [Meiothermus ruber]
SSPYHAGGVLFCYIGSASAGIETPKGGTMQRVVQALTILTLLALAPALAQGSQSSFKPTNPALVLPVGQELSDGELAEVEGKIFWFAVAGAVAGATYEIARQAFSFEQPDWRKIGVSALEGAAMGAFPAVAVYGRAATVIKGADEGVNATALAASAGTVVGAARGATQNPNAKPNR